MYGGMLTMCTCCVCIVTMTTPSQEPLEGEDFVNFFACMTCDLRHPVCTVRSCERDFSKEFTRDFYRPERQCHRQIFGNAGEHFPNILRHPAGLRSNGGTHRLWEAIGNF